MGPSIIRHGNDGPGDHGDCQARAATLGLYLLPAHYVTLSKSLPLSGSQFLSCQMRVADDRPDCLGAGCLPPHLAPKRLFSEPSIKVWDFAVGQRHGSHSNHPLWPLIPTLGARMLALTGRPWGHSLAPVPSCSCRLQSVTTCAPTAGRCLMRLLPQLAPSDVGTLEGSGGGGSLFQCSAHSCQVPLHRQQCGRVPPCAHCQGSWRAEQRLRYMSVCLSFVHVQTAVLEPGPCILSIHLRMPLSDILFF